MRILVPTTEFPPAVGGVASLAFEQACGLARQGHKVCVLAAVDCATPSVGNADFAIDYLSVKAGAIKRLVPLTLALREKIRSFQPDIIWTPTYRGFGLPISILSRLHRHPYGVYLHGSEVNTEAKSRVRRRIMQAVLDRASLVISNSQNTARLLNKKFPALRNPVVPITPGVNPDQFSRPGIETEARRLRESWNAHFNLNEVNSGPVYLVSLCRMSRTKGIDLVLRALAELVGQPSRQNLRYVVAGGGPDLAYFKTLTAELGLDNIVLLLGPIEYGKTAPILHAADVMVQPSQPIGDFLESFGISFLEAQISGLPCIGSDWGGVPEAVKANESAILVPVGDVIAIAGAISLLAGNAQLRSRMGNAGRIWAAQNTWQAHAKSLSKHLQEAVQI